MPDDTRDPLAAVVCRGIPNKPFIAALVCMECEAEIMVNNGYIVGVAPENKDAARDG
jgi:hypothetical protein